MFLRSPAAGVGLRKNSNHITSENLETYPHFTAFFLHSVDSSYSFTLLVYWHVHFQHNDAIKGFKGKKGVAFDASVTFDAGFTLTLSFPKNGNGRKRK